METKTIIEIILILVSAGIIAYVLLGKNSFLRTDSNREICRTSVIARWMAKRIGSENIFQLNCKSHLTTISESTLSGAKNPEDMIKETIAKEMYDCWYEFNRGQFDFENMFKTALTGSKQICVVCADITFDSYVSKNYPVVNGFNNWTIDNSVPGKDYSYYDYLTNDKGASIKKEVKALSSSADAIDTEKDYQVVFSVQEGSNTQSLLQTTTITTGFMVGLAAGGPIGGAIGAAAGAIGGYLASLWQANQYVPMTLMVPTESTPQYCKVFY